MPKLLAISDLHLRYDENRQLITRLPASEDWLIVAGDVGETPEHLTAAWQILGERFARLFWVPGNHELWAAPNDPVAGEAKYQRMVEVCRAHGVVTPEDAYLCWTGDGGPCVIAPLFVLYDYSFRPEEVSEAGAVAWAKAAGLLCADERYLRPEPHPSRQAWCHARVELSERRLAEAAAQHPLVIVNHFPLRYDLVRLPFIPRFSIWCGTRLTHDWHTRFRAKVVVSGHLHVRATDYRDGVRFEEVSLGYPRQYDPQRAPSSFLREILPGPI